MTRRQFIELVASATGESVREIARRGFGLERPVDEQEDDELPPQFLDWDELEATRLDCVG